MNKGLLFIGVAFLFASYHAFINKSVTLGMYQTNIMSNNLIYVVGTVTLLFGLLCIITALGIKK